MNIMGQPHRKACKLNFHWKICGDFVKAPLQGSKILGAPFLHQVTQQVFVNGRGPLHPIPVVAKWVNIISRQFNVFILFIFFLFIYFFFEIYLFIYLFIFL